MMPLLADKTVPPIERLADKIVPLTELMGALLKEDKGAEGRVDRVDFLAVDQIVYPGNIFSRQIVREISRQNSQRDQQTKQSERLSDKVVREISRQNSQRDKQTKQSERLVDKIVREISRQNSQRDQQTKQYILEREISRQIKYTQQTKCYSYRILSYQNLTPVLFKSDIHNDFIIDRTPALQMKVPPLQSKIRYIIATTKTPI